MKVKTKRMSYDEVMALPRPKHKKPKRPNILFKTLLKLVSLPDLIATNFKCRRIGMKKLGKREPCLYLMNHSSFIDLEIAASVLYPRPFNIVATWDAFIGKRWLMRNLGCIPTVKFAFDVGLVRDIFYAVREKKSSVLIYPEAGYSLDGTATVFPENFAQFVKKLGIPVAMIRTYGAFTRDLLYNNLQRRRVRVSADIEYLFSKEELEEKSEEEIFDRIRACFAFDNFRWQSENKVRVDAPFRADYLNRVLYKCPHCLKEGVTEGKGEHLFCHACGSKYRLDEYGRLEAVGHESLFTYVSDWFAWQRKCVREEILAGKYSLDIPVDIAMQVDTKALYFVGEGRLTHNTDGFLLQGCDGKLSVTQGASHTYSVNADYNFYEIGDMVSFGNTKAIYYCFPKTKGDFVAKTRLATEEIYRLLHAPKMHE